MQLLIYGASGGTGQQIVSQAIAQGHHVTAFARNPASITMQHPNLRVVQGDITDEQSVRAAMPGHDVVISALGTRSGQQPVLAEGTRIILDAMKDTGIRRSIWVSSFGAGDSLEQMGWAAKNIIVPLFLKQALLEKDRQEKIIMGLGQDWIIARPGGLTDGPKTGVYREITDTKTQVGRPSISRADVADFVLKNLTDTRYVCRAVGLTY
jgi:putative NADH-flavin reductase